jgi:hypothetical protein
MFGTALRQSLSAAPRSTAGNISDTIVTDIAAPLLRAGYRSSPLLSGIALGIAIGVGLNLLMRAQQQRPGPARM